MQRMFVAGALVAVALLGAAGCTTARAVAPPVERPVLDVPAVPPRLVEPVPLPPPPGPEPVPELPPASPTKPNAKPAGSTAKPEKAETPPVEPPPVPPTPPLRTPGTPDAAEATRRIREISARAQSILDNTDYQLLNQERQAQYQNAKLLINQSEEAIKASNFEFARNLAEKAERLAKELRGGLAPQP